MNSSDKKFSFYNSRSKRRQRMNESQGARSDGLNILT